MRLVNKVLSIIVGILLSIVVLVGIVCAVYTFSSAAVRDGVGQLSELLDGGLGSIKDAVGELVDSDLLSGLVSGVTSSSGSGGSGGGFDLSDAGSILGLGGGGDTSAESFADPTQGAAYQSWKDVISEPVQRVFAGTGIDETMLEGISGGSATATDVLTQLDESTLVTISNNASRLSQSAAANVPSSVLPASVQQDMNNANQACIDFCTQVQQLVENVRSLRAGNLLSAASLYSSAGSAKAALDSMESSMLSAEAALGA